MAGGFSTEMSGCIDFLQSIGGTKQEATALLKDTRWWLRKKGQGKKRRKAVFSIGRMNDL